MKRWYDQARFRCPGCGQAMAVDKAQVRRHDRVTCQRCNTDLLLAPRGAAVTAEPDWRTGERATVVEIPL